MPWEILKYAGILAAMVLMIFVVRARRRAHYQFLHDYGDAEICDHLRPALDALRARGHDVTRAGQRAEDYPVELHISPPFDPKALFDELKLEEPARLSDRNVIICVEDMCELHPRK
jgi:hypothetical protein